MENHRGKKPSPHNDGQKLLKGKTGLLTVFQASPLAYLDMKGKIHPLSMLDFESERNLLAEALKEGGDVLGAKVRLVFETATTDRLGAFLAKGRQQLLHFSCHGHPKYLFVENDQGGGQMLMVEDLKEWIKAGKNSLHFVFVSACHSRSAGEAFLAAGVPHVVCCQHDNQALQDTAAVEFARAFYRALACGKKLSEAFELGRHSVGVAPTVKDAQTEMNNFVLLPEGKDHDVDIFYAEESTGQRNAAEQVSETTGPTGLPLSPQPRPFLGRESDMYKILEALKSGSRLVRVTGPSGIGKRSLVQAVCHYVSSRRLTYSYLGEIFCLPSGQGIPSNDLLSCFAALFEKIDSHKPSWSFSEDDFYKEYRGQILESLHSKRVLIVVDASGLLLSESLYKLCIFLEDLFRGTEHVKVIAIRELALDLTSPTVRRFSCVETDIEVCPLDFVSTTLLFGIWCPHVSNGTCPEVDSPGKLLKLLVPPDQSHLNPLSGGFSKRSRDILKRLGDGHPAMVHRAAKDMTENQYGRLIDIGRRKEIRAHKSKFQTRAKLEDRLSELAEEVSTAVREKDFHRAEEFQEEFDEIERLREELPDLLALENTSNSLTQNLDRAVRKKDFKMAEKLQTELDSITAQIKLEEESLPKNDESVGLHGTLLQDGTAGDEGDGNDSRKPAPVASRAALEAEIRQQKALLDEAFEAHRMDEVRSIDKKLSQLESRRRFFPTSNQLLTRLNHYNSELLETKRRRDWDRSEALVTKIEDLTAKLEGEKAAEAEFNTPTLSLHGDSMTDEDSNAAAALTPLSLKRMGSDHQSPQNQGNRGTGPGKASKLDVEKKGGSNSDILEKQVEPGPELPDLLALENTSNSMTQDLDRAVRKKDFKMAAKLQTELDSVAAKLQTELDSITSQIKLEEEPLPKNDESVGLHGTLFQDGTAGGEGDGNDSRKPAPVASRAALEAEIRQQKALLDEAFEAHRMDEVRSIDKELSQLESRRLFFPTSNQLLTRLNHSNSELMEAKRQRDWDRSEALVTKIEDLTTKLELEKASEAEFNTSTLSPRDSSMTAEDSNAAAALTPLSLKRMGSDHQSPQNQGNRGLGLGKASKLDGEKKGGSNTVEPRPEETKSDVRRQQETPLTASIEQQRATSSTTREASVPGAHAIDGRGISSAIDADVVQAPSDVDSVQERIERTIENMAVPSHAEPVLDIESQRLGDGNFEAQELQSSSVQPDLLQLVGRLGLAITCMIVTVILVTSGVISCLFHWPSDIGKEHEQKGTIIQ